MPGVIVDPELIVLLEATRGRLNTYQLALFVNNYTPSPTTVIGDLVEASFGGYSRIPLTGWVPAAGIAGDKAETHEVTRTFTCTGAPLTETVYGYYLVTPTGGLAGAQRNPAGGTPINAAGLAYPVLCRLTLANA